MHSTSCEFRQQPDHHPDARDQVIEVVGGAGAAPASLPTPWSIALDSKGNPYIADSQNHRAAAPGGSFKFSVFVFSHQSRQE